MKRKGNLSLENYADFTENPKEHDLSVNQLNQIINVHGFMKLRLQKKVIVDIVNEIDFMKPFRSTLKENISSSAAVLTFEELVEDLSTLQWQECSVQSIKILSSGGKENVTIDDLRTKFCASSTVHDEKAGKSEAKKKRKSMKSPVTASAPSSLVLYLGPC